MMANEINGNKPDPRFWTSRKFWMTVLGAGIFLALALTKTMTFTNAEAITVILGLIGFNVGAHAATDIASIVTGNQRDNGARSLRVPVFKDEPEEKKEEDEDTFPSLDVKAPMPTVKTPKKTYKDGLSSKSPRAKR